MSSSGNDANKLPEEQLVRISIRDTQSQPPVDYRAFEGGLPEQDQQNFRSGRAIFSFASSFAMFAMISPSGNSTRERECCAPYRLLPDFAGSCACNASARERDGGSSSGCTGSSVFVVSSAGSSPGGLSGRPPT
jgi:hypothetical protein